MSRQHVDLKRLWNKTGFMIVALIVLGLALAILADQAKAQFKLAKPEVDGIRAFIVLMVGGGISYVLERYLFHLMSRTFGPSRTTSIRFIIRLILLFAVLLAMLSAFGVGLSSVVFGGAFVTAVIGLAGQTMFGNLIAGIAILLFHPFQVGDRINFVAWQYPILMPSFPHEAMKPAYAGVVTDITLMYTSMLTDSGPVMVVPNGIMIQAIVENLARTKTRIIRMRFDVDIALDPAVLMPRIEKLLTTLGFSGAKPQIIDMTPTTYAVLLMVDTKMKSDEEIRHQVFGHVVPMVQKLAKTPPPDPQQPPISAPAKA